MSSGKKSELITYGDPIKGAKNSIGNGNIAVGMLTATQAKLLAPVKTGQFRNSIQWETPSRRGGINDSPGETTSETLGRHPSKDEAFVGSSLARAVWLEYGTRKMDPKPSIRPAGLVVGKAGATKQELVTIVQDFIKQAVKNGPKRRYTK